MSEFIIRFKLYKVKKLHSFSINVLSFLKYSDFVKCKTHSSVMLTPFN